MAFTNTYFIKFDDEQQFIEKALEVGVLEMIPDEENPGQYIEEWRYYTADWAVDVLGVIYNDDGVYDEETGEVITPPTPIDGFHVNCKWNGAVPLTFSTRQIFPATPRRIFYGDDLTAIAAAAAAAGASAGY